MSCQFLGGGAGEGKGSKGVPKAFKRVLRASPSTLRAEAGDVFGELAVIYESDWALLNPCGAPIEPLWNFSPLPPPPKPKTSNNQLTLINLEPINLQKTTSPTRACTRQLDTSRTNMWGES